jgi:hypothetical protein
MQSTKPHHSFHWIWNPGSTQSATSRPRAADRTKMRLRMMKAITG